MHRLTLSVGLREVKGTHSLVPSVRKRTLGRTTEVTKHPLISAHSLQDPTTKDGVKCLLTTYTLGNLSGVASSKKGLVQNKAQEC